MTTRRRFLRDAAIAIPAIAFANKLWSAAAPTRLGVQLYTVRNQVEKDLAGTLKQIRAIGYDDVELYWNVYSHPAAELKQIIAAAGLKAPSGHFDYEKLDAKMWQYARTLGLEWVVCPMLPESMWHSRDAFLRAAEQFNAWGKTAASHGMRFGFHNHNYEFRKFGEQTGFELLMQHTDPTHVAIEMDCYWITQAGYSPVEMMKKYGHRIRMLHLKDRKPGFPASHELNDAAGHFTEVGHGAIDWPVVLREAKAIGVEHYFVEQDESDKPPIESIRESYKYLRSLA